MFILMQCYVKLKIWFFLTIIFYILFKIEFTSALLFRSKYYINHILDVPKTLVEKSADKELRNLVLSIFVFLDNFLTVKVVNCQILKCFFYQKKIISKFITLESEKIIFQVALCIHKIYNLKWKKYSIYSIIIYINSTNIPYNYFATFIQIKSQNIFKLHWNKSS